MPDSEDQDRVSMEMSDLSFKTEQLLERRTMLNLLLEFRSRVSYMGPVEADTAGQLELNLIDEQLRQLSERKAELQELQDRAWSRGPLSDHRENSISSGSQMFTITVEPPPAPSSPAPKVILDVTQLPGHASRAQCPACHQFITTETVTSVGSVTWLACCMMVMIGCCLVPFCVDNCKDVTHKCPRCRSSIQTVKRL